VFSDQVAIVTIIIFIALHLPALTLTYRIAFAGIKKLPLAESLKVIFIPFSYYFIVKYARQQSHKVFIIISVFNTIVALLATALFIYIKVA
jgi:hypothetical protein